MRASSHPSGAVKSVDDMPGASFYFTALCAHVGGQAKQCHVTVDDDDWGDVGEEPFFDTASASAATAEDVTAAAPAAMGGGRSRTACQEVLEGGGRDGGSWLR